MDEVLDAAVDAYEATPGERPGMIAALTAAGLYEPGALETALTAFRHGYHGTRESMRQALAACGAAIGRNPAMIIYLSHAVPTGTGESPKWFVVEPQAQPWPQVESLLSAGRRVLCITDTGNDPVVKEMG